MSAMTGTAPALFIIMNEVPMIYFFIFSSNSEAFASELLKNIEVMLQRY